VNQNSILVFSVVVGLIFVVADVYVLYSFRQFIRKQSYSPWWYRCMWMLSAVALAMYVVVAWRRHLFRIDGIDLKLFMAVSLWYVPKLPVALVIGIVSMVRGLRKLLRSKETQVVPDKKREDMVLISRRKLLGSTAWGMASVPFAVMADGMIRTVYDFTVVHHDLVLNSLPPGLIGYKIVQISDIHAGSFLSSDPFQEVRRIVDSINPNLVVITGDFVNAVPDELLIVQQALKKMAANFPVYATLGNHDHYNTADDHARLIQRIRGYGIDLLNNEHRLIGEGADRFVLAGIDNVGFRQNYGNIGRALQGVPPDSLTMLLAHDPTFWDKAVVGKQPVDVMLSGHTHGGQVALNVMGFTVSPANFVYEQVAGLYKKGNQLLYVNSGIGTVGPPVRIGVPPEITVFTLKSALKMSSANA